MKRLIPTIALAGAIFLTPAHAADIVTNLAQTVDGGDLLSPAGDASAQAFLTGPVAMRMEEVTVRLSATVGSVARVQVWTGAGTIPATLVEDLGTVPVNVNGGAATNYTIASTARPFLAPTTRYWVSVANVSGSLDWKITGSTVSTGAGSISISRATSADGGANWSAFGSGNRHLFAVRGSRVRIVNTISDGAGASTLRNTIAAADPGDVIEFSEGLNGLTITLSSGDIDLTKNLTIDASALSGGLTISGNNASRIFDVDAGPTVALRGLTLSGGNGDGAFSGYGGAIYNTNSTLTLTRCTLTGNSGRFGGAIYSATAGITGPITSSTTLTHCTLAGNTATERGGAIRNFIGRTTLTHCTVSGNTAPAGQGSGVASYGDANTETVVQNSIIAGNTNSDADFTDNTTNSFTSLRGNLIGSGNATGDFNQPGDLINSAPLLAGLGKYGGPMKTMPPLSGSPAVNAALGFPGATDQRGFAIGATVYENDFSTGGLGGATAHGSGVVDAANFRLTPAAQGQEASLVLPAPPAFTTFAASFDLSYTTGAGSPFNGPADGISFSFGPNPNGTANENGVPGAHRISLNIYNSADPSDGLLRYINPAGAVVGAQFPFPRFGDAGIVLPLTVTLDAAGTLTVTYKGQVALSVPNIGYTHADGDTFTFGARTGGDVSEQRVDNICILTDPAGGAPDIGAVESGLAIPGFTPVVTNNTDLVDGLDNGISLREAVVFGPAGTPITFDPTALNGETITLGGTQLTIDKSLTIDASALTAGINLSGGSSSRHFNVSTGGALTLRGLTLTDGQGSFGGSIFNAGLIDIQDCTFTGNHATSNSGVIEAGGIGGIITGSTFYGNTAGGIGGAVSTNNTQPLLVTHCTFTGNTATKGGALYSFDGGLQVVQTTVSGNTATSGGGGLFVQGGTVTLDNTILAANIAPAQVDIRKEGGTLTAAGLNLISVLDNSGLTEGSSVLVADPLLAPLGDYGGPTPTMPPLPGSPAMDAAGTSDPGGTDQRGAPRFLDGDGDTTAALDIGAVEFVPTIVANHNDSGTDSLREVITREFASTVTFDLGLDGDTIPLTSPITLDKALGIDATALPGGITLNGGGTTWFFSVNGSGGSPAIALHGLTLTGGGAPNSGGAIQNSGATLSLTRCTLSGNSSGEGGAIFSSTPGVALALTHCTLTGNSAGSGGGAIFAVGTLTLRHCTVSDNSAGTAGGGVGFSSSGTFILENSIVAGNTASSGADIHLTGTPSFFRNGANIAQHIAIEVTEMLTGGPDPIDAAPLLAPFGDYGGPTFTMPPLPGSPAIDAAAGSPETTDQRGFPIVATADIGAAEFQGSSDLSLYWELDFDGDGNPFGVEHALGTDPLVSDPGHTSNLTVPTFNGVGHATLTFGLNPAAEPHTIWLLKRSTTLLPGSFTEIYRYDGPSEMETLGTDITATGTANSFTVIDLAPPPGKAFYRFEAQTAP